MAEVIVDLNGFEDDLFKGLNNSREIRRALMDFIDDTHDLWKRLAPAPTGAPAPKDLTVRERYATYKRVKDLPGHPYSTGQYKESIKKNQIRKWQKIFYKGSLRKEVLLGRVYTNDENALRIEYGTGADGPGSRSPWGPRTSTPEYAPMRKTFAIMRSRGNIEHRR